MNSYQRERLVWCGVATACAFGAAAFGWPQSLPLLVMGLVALVAVLIT